MNAKAGSKALAATIEFSMNRDQLSSNLKSLRAMVARPGNDYSWTSWFDEKAALAEIDAIIAKFGCGDPGAQRSIASILMPTGPAQELAISSGWGNEFNQIADAIEAAIADQN